jgi:microcystin-dependent protein
MSSPYIGEIRMFGGNFAPAGWFTCDGQLLQISEYSALFQLIGTTYGGDGQTTFALPKLTGRVPVHMGTGAGLSTYVIGAQGGVQNVTLTTNQIPSHTHPIVADNNNATTNQTSPVNDFYGNASPAKIYSAKTSGLHPMMTLPAQGGSQPHDNMQPYQAVTYIISLFGVFPSQN